MKPLIIFSLLLISMLTPAAAQQDSDVYRLNLEQCLDYAFANNYGLQSYGLTKESKEWSYRQSKNERLPDVNISLSESFSNAKSGTTWSGNDGINAGMTLYKGGNLNAQIKKAQQQLEQSDHEIKQQENYLTIQILQAFLTVLGNDELLKYQETVLTTSEEQMKQGEIMYQAGSILESDYLLLKAQYATDYSNIVNTRIARDNSILALKALLSMNPSLTLEIVPPDTSAVNSLAQLPTQDYVVERAWATLPQLKLAESNISIAETGVKISRSGFFPTLSLSAGVNTGHSPDFEKYGTQIGDNLKENVSLSLSIPIFNNLRNKTNVAQSKIALEQAELEQRQTELDLIQTLTQEYQNVVSAYAKYEALSVKELAYRESFKAFNVQFNAGAITPVDLLQQQNNYISALNDYIQGKYDFILKRKILDVYMGEPVKM